MKNTINKFVVLLLAAFAWVSCTENTEYNDTAFSRVEKLLYPSDNTAIELINQANASVYFEWEASKTGTPIYTVVFYDDKKVELGRYLADDNGGNTSYTANHNTLSEVALYAGINAGETGDVYWNVICGLNDVETISAVPSRKLTLTRHMAALDIPYTLYITGSGSEFGTDVASAQKINNPSKGVFEIYTKINGEFRFINRTADGNKRTFGFDQNGAIIEGADAMATAPEGVYRITLNLNKNKASMEAISSVGLYEGGKNDSPLTTLAYEANGVWVAKQFTIPTGGDDRYRFKAVVDGKPEVWSSKDGRDASDPGTVDPSSTYFRIYTHSDQSIADDSYGCLFKFHAPLKGMKIDVKMAMTPGMDFYKHIFDLGFEIITPQVSKFNTPAADAKIALTAVADSKVNFSWDKPADCPQLVLTKYTVIFTSDAAGKTVVGSKSAEFSNTIDISHQDLENIAAAAEVAAEGVGSIYWTIQTELISVKAMATVEPRKLEVTRMKGVPSKAYITGSATEYASTYAPLKKTGTGLFEMFTKLKAGTYNFTDGTAADSRKFIVNNGKLEESSDVITVTTEAVYCITLNFVAGTVKYQKIENMRFVSPPMKGTPADHVQIPYQGKGIWYAANVVPKTNGGWDDDRYFYWAEVDGVKTKFGAKPGMSGDLNDVPAERDERFRVFWPIADVENDDAGAYKVTHAYRGNSTKKANIKVNMNSDEENYYNHIEYLNL